ncbi:hypothetical protein ACWDZ8_03765 [Streptomyces sp. NPDC003233]
MPIHHTLSPHPRTTAPTTDESGRTGAGADGGTATGPHTAWGAGAVRPDTLPPPPAARATLHDDQADATPGVTDGAVSVSPARHDDGTAANRPLRTFRNTRHSTLPRSTTAPPAVADAGPIDGVTSGAPAVSPARHGNDGTAANRPLRTPLPRSTTAPPAVADAGLNPGATLRDDPADACRTLGIEGVTSGAPAVSPARHGDDGTAANRPLRTPLPRSTTAPPAVADADLNPGGTLRDDRAGGRRCIGLERVARGNPAVAAPLLLKVA